MWVLMGSNSRHNRVAYFGLSNMNTLVNHGVDQKWFSAFARLIEGAEEMVTTQETRAVSLG